MSPITPNMTILLFTLFIYILIVVAFNKARIKYAGGKIGDVINLILITVILLFVSDYVRLVENQLPENIVFTVQTMFRTIALSFLAYGGTKVAGK